MNAQQPILVKTDQAHLEIDVEYAKAVLERFSNPWHRYLLTLYLDATAEALQNSIATISRRRSPVRDATSGAAAARAN